MPLNSEKNLNLTATSNLIEDYNRDGIVNDGVNGPLLNELADGIDYDRNGVIGNTVIESDRNGDGRLSRGTGFRGEIFIDINNPDGDAANRLTFAELTSTPVKELFNAGISTEAYADIRLAADTDFSRLPAITADLTLDWAIGLTTRDGLVGGGLPDIVIHDVTLDLGSFLTSAIAPVFESFDKYVGPVRPLVDFLASPVPGLNDLSELLSGPRITFLTLGLLGASRNADTIRQAQRAQQIVGLIQNIFEFSDSINAAARDGNDIKVNFGTFYVTGKPEQIVAGPTLPGTALRERILPNNPRTGTPITVQVDGDVVPVSQYTVVKYKDNGVSRTKLVFNTAPSGTVTATYTTTVGGTKDLTDKNAVVKVDDQLMDSPIEPGPNGGISTSVLNQTGNSGKAGSQRSRSLLTKLGGNPDSKGNGGFGINIPLLSDPANIFKLFTGEKADIIQWDIPRLELSVPFRMKFGNIPFPPVPLYATFSAKLEAFLDFSIGFDTRGIAKTGNFIDGFYFGDLENVTSGFDIDEFGISLEATVGAAVDLAVASAGIEGGVRANLAFNWNDLDGDGKIYLDELSDLFQLRPTPSTGADFPGICVFDAHGSVNAFVRAYYDVLFFGGDSFNIVDIELFKFNHSCTAPGLAELTSGDSRFEDGTLVLFAGEFAEERQGLYGDNPDEEFEVSEFVDEHGERFTQVTFHYLNRDNEPDTTTRSYKGVRQIYFSGGSGNDKITLHPSVTTPAKLLGGEGDDILIGGSGDDVISGGRGNDTISGGLGNDRYVFANNWGQDIVIDGGSGFGNNDVFDFSAVNTSLTVSYGVGTTVQSGSNRVDAGAGADGARIGTAGIERIIAGSAVDTLQVSQVVGAGSQNRWNLSGVGKGDINSQLFFDRFENLTGGQQDDYFSIDAGDSILGIIDGQGGTDTLDYSSMHSPILVNRQLETANSIGGFRNIEAIRAGTSPNDRLIGLNEDARWTLTGVNSGEVSRQGSALSFRFEGFENLTGGDKDDHFVMLTGSRLSGTLLGTTTPGVQDNDTVDLSTQTAAMRVNVMGDNRGEVILAQRVVDFASVESVFTGFGDDRFVMAPLASLRGTIDGGGGARDHLDYSLWTSGVTVDLAAATNHVGSVYGIEDVTGGSGDDTLTGNASGNRLIGNGGRDSLHGNGGDNILIGDAAEIVLGGTSISSIRTIDTSGFNDVITAGNGNNIVIPGLGDDVVTLGNGNNFVAGDAILITLSGNQVVSMQSTQSTAGGNDVIHVGSGNDVIIAGSGDDAIVTAGGRNVIIGDRGSVQMINGLPSVAVSKPGIFSGNDYIVSGDGGDAIIAGGGSDVIVAGDGNNFILADDGSLFFEVGVATSYALHPTVFDGDDHITSGAGRDVILTGNGNNEVYAGDGDDDVIGGEGMDVLYGEGGDDFMVGHFGDDILDGGDGNDVLFGGMPVGVRGNYRLGTSDFVLPPDFALLESLYSSNPDPDYFGRPGITTGGYLPEVLITPAIFNGQSIDGVPNDGRDILRGQAGNDVLLGGSDADQLFGGDGADYLDAGAGDDVIEGGDGDDVLRGGKGNDLLKGGDGIDQLYGDEGDDTLYGDAGTNGVQAGQRLIGGEGRDRLFAFAPLITSLSEYGAQTLLAGDQLFGGPGDDFLHGNARREVFVGGAGNDFITGDEFVGASYQTHLAAGIGTEADTHGADDLIFGGGGNDQLYGGGGNDEIWGGAGTDFIDGQQGSDKMYGGSGIDIFVLPTSLGRNGLLDTGVDTIDGHYGNQEFGDVEDDNAVDILTIDGTSGNDVILIGRQNGQASVRFNGTAIPVTMLDSAGNFLIDQFRIAGMAGNDTIGFYTEAALQAGAISPVPGLSPLDLTELSNRTNDFVGVFDGNSGNDILLGGAGRDRLDGGIGSDVLYGFGGDDRLWGDSGGGTPVDHDRLFAGQGNDDLVGGQGTNELFAWSFDPLPSLIGPLPPGVEYNQQFGVFVDGEGNLYHDDGDLNDNGILDIDDAVPVGPGRLAFIQESTGLNRLLGSTSDDVLYGGTVLDFLYGNGGNDTLVRSDGSTFVSADEGVAGEEWKDYARESDQVWYVGGTNAADRINVDFVTEPGLLSDHHLITRLTNNNGNFSFAAQVRLDFSAEDANGNPVWSTADLKFELDQLLALREPDKRRDLLYNISEAGQEDFVESEILNKLLPPEGDFLVILIDALGGNDHITVGPTVQKSVWIDAGDGDDIVEILAGNSILVDRAENATGVNGLRSRNDIPTHAFKLLTAESGQLAAFEGTQVVADGVEFNGLSIDNPSDVDWFQLRLSQDSLAASLLELASGSQIDALLIDLYEMGADTTDPENKINASSYATSGARSSISLAGLVAGESYLVRVSSPNLVPTTYDLRFNLTGTTDPAIVAELPKVAMTLRSNAVRRDIILGGRGDDILRGGAGEDWIFGNDGNDVLIGGYDRGAPDLLFGGAGDDTFQIIPDKLPLLGSQPNTNFVPATATEWSTLSDLMVGGEGRDRVLFLGGDFDRRGFKVPDYAALRYNTVLHRYEFTSLVWDIGLQKYRTTFADSNGNGVQDPGEATVYEQEYLFFQTREIEDIQFEMRAGDDVVHVDSPAGNAFKFLPIIDVADGPDILDLTADSRNFEEWGIRRGDREQGATEAIILNGGAGNDFLYGSPYSDTITGGPGDDYLVGGIGNDIIDGGGGADIIYGNQPAPADAYSAYPFTPSQPDNFQFFSFPSEAYVYNLAPPYLSLPSDRSGVELYSDNGLVEIDNVVRDAFGGTAAGSGPLSTPIRIGDFNDDGHDDFIVSGDHFSYVILGPFAVDNLVDILERADITISHEALGRPADSAGDINGDGIPDLAFVRNDAGRTHVRVIYGNKTAGAAGAGLIGWPKVWNQTFVDNMLRTTGHNYNSREFILSNAQISSAGLRLSLLNYDGGLTDDLLLSSSSKQGTLNPIYDGVLNLIYDTGSGDSTVNANYRDFSNDQLLVNGDTLLALHNPGSLVLDDYSSNKFTSYNFFSIFNNATNDPQLNDGRLNMNVGNGTGALIWNEGEVLNEVNDQVSIDFGFNYPLPTGGPFGQSSVGLALFSSNTGGLLTELRVLTPKTTPVGSSFSDGITQTPLSAAPAGAMRLMATVTAKTSTTLTMTYTLSAAGIESITGSQTFDVPEVYFGPVAFDVTGEQSFHDNFKVSRKGEVYSLTPTEYNLLHRFEDEVVGGTVANGTVWVATLESPPPLDPARVRIFRQVGDDFIFHSQFSQQNPNSVKMATFVDADGLERPYLTSSEGLYDVLAQAVLSSSVNADIDVRNGNAIAWQAGVPAGAIAHYSFDTPNVGADSSGSGNHALSAFRDRPKISYRIKSYTFGRIS